MWTAPDWLHLQRVLSVQQRLHGAGPPPTAALPRPARLAQAARVGGRTAGRPGPHLAAGQQGPATFSLCGPAGPPSRDHPTPPGRRPHRWRQLGAAAALAAHRMAHRQGRAGQVLAQDSPSTRQVPIRSCETFLQQGGSHLPSLEHRRADRAAGTPQVLLPWAGRQNTACPSQTLGRRPPGSAAHRRLQSLWPRFQPSVSQVRQVAWTILPGCPVETSAEAGHPC
jgi:hypothetical protein